MPDVVIRRAAPDDAAALSLVGRATLLETYAAMVGFADLLAFARGGHSAAAYQAFLDDPACAAWIAIIPQTGVPVGFALVTPPDLPVETGPADLELRRIYLLSKFQGAGIGRGLFDHALTQGREAGKQRLLLGVKADNPAIGFYRRMGAEQVGTRRFLVGETLFDDLILAIGL